METDLVYVIHLYPHGQTDIVNELRALESAGIDTTIVAFQKRRELNSIRVPFKTRFPVIYLQEEGEIFGTRLIREHLKALSIHTSPYLKTACISARFRGANFKRSVLILKQLEKLRPSLVYTPWAWSFSGSTMYACIMLGIPYIFAVRGTEIFPPDQDFRCRVNMAKRILTVAEGYAELMRKNLGVPETKLRVVRPCLGPTDFLGRVKIPREKITGPLRLLNVATLRPVKRHGDLIRVADFLKQNKIDFELRICGDGPDREAIEQAIGRYSLQKEVKLLGHLRQDKLIEQFQWCDIYVHTSESESFCFSVIEAQASARPIVAYDAKGGIRQSVVNHKSAILAPVGDVKGFVKQIMKLCNDDELRQNMSATGREFVRKRFSSFNRFATDFVNALLET